MNKARQLAKERLERDILNGIRVGAALHASFCEDAKDRLDHVLKAEHRLTIEIISVLERNWRITERSRGERVAT